MQGIKHFMSAVVISPIFLMSICVAQSSNNEAESFKRLCDASKEVDKSIKIEGRATVTFYRIRLLDNGHIGSIETVFIHPHERFVQELNEQCRWCKFRDGNGNLYLVFLSKEFSKDALDSAVYVKGIFSQLPSSWGRQNVPDCLFHEEEKAR